MAEALTIDRRLGKARDRINRVGVELEGGWKTLPRGVELTHDGSVKGFGNDRPSGAGLDVEVFTDTQGRQMLRPRRRAVVAQPTPTAEPPRHVGELVSEPLSLRKEDGNIFLDTWVRSYYPSHVNSTCGLHVHMSFKNALHYQKLMVPEYQATVAAYLIEWAKAEGFPKDHFIWKRLKGENEYCKFEFFPEQQASSARKVYDHHREGNRYTAINYPYAMHSTVECRILPMMETAEQALRAIHRVLDITNATLSVMGKKERGMRTSPIMGERLEEHRVLSI